MDVQKALDRLKDIATTEEARLTAEILEFILTQLRPTHPIDSRQQSANRLGVQVDFGKPKD